MSNNFLLENEFIELLDVSYNFFAPEGSPKNKLYVLDDDDDDDDDAGTNIINSNSKNKTITKKTNITSQNKIEITYYNFYKYQLVLTTYKLPELKIAAKNNKLHISGTKKVLIDRLIEHFNMVKHGIMIQKIFRGWIVRLSFRLRGPALLNRALCVNDTDFVSMEPLKEIDYESFFSYTDNKNFTYGFNLASIMQMINNQYQKYNPYNREKIDATVILNITTLYNLSMIIYPKFKNENEIVNSTESTVMYASSNNVSRRTRINNSNNPTVNTRRPNYAQTISHENRTLYFRILELRSQSIDQRIQNLFMEIDHLGNYTNTAWFINMEARQYIRLYRALYEVWNYRSQLSRSVRLRICQFGDPFSDYLQLLVNMRNDSLNVEQLQNICLIVFENMVYSGIDDDHRKLGAFHALSALTMTSYEAREALPWLYESVVY